MLKLLVALLVSFLAATVPAVAADPARYMTVGLITESNVPRPGSTILIGIQFAPRPGWHGYWSNPGDSGIAPQVHWSAPKGMVFGPLMHPAPVLLTADGVSSYVHEGEHTLLSRVTIPSAFAPGRVIPIVADLSWAACTATQCVPLHAELALALKTGDGSKSADWPALQTAIRKLPNHGPSGVFVRNGRNLSLRVPPSLRLNSSTVRFFADEAGAFDTAAGHATRSDGRMMISTTGGRDLPDQITGVLSDGHVAYRLKFVRSNNLAEGPALATVRMPSPLPAQRVEQASHVTAAAKEADAAEVTGAKLSSLWLIVAAVAVIAIGIFLGFRRSS